MRRILREHAAPAATFLLAFGAYLATLAPAVTFEDSGELATAAWLLGVAHEPGYPLWTLLAHAWTWLPAGTVAWRVALLSAAGMAAGAAFITRAVQVSLRGAGSPGDSPLVADFIALASGLLAAFAAEAWEQAVIVEVYGLNFALFGALCCLAAGWLKAADDGERRRRLHAAAALLALAIGHHPTAMVVAPALLVFALATGLARILDARTLGLAAAAFAAGLLPLLYLPLASASNPALDWGDPDNATRVWRVLARAQYGHSWPGAAEAGGRVVRFLQFAREQWPPALLALPLAGAAWLWRHERRLLLLAALLFFAAGPLSAAIIDLPLPAGDARVDEENRALASVFFIPAYGVLAYLAAFGLQALVALAPARRRAALAAVALLAPAAAGLANGPRADLSAHHWAEAYVANLFRDAPDGALVLTQWDPFYFPTVYAQQVDGERPDLTILDTELLRRSWYVRQLLRHDRLAQAVREPAERFLEAVAPFEDGAPYDGLALETAYVDLQRAFIDAARARGRAVLATQVPPADVLRDDAAEPRVAAYLIGRAAGPPAAVPLEEYRLAEFMDPRVANDRMALMMRRHFGERLRERARLLAKDDPAEAAAAARRASALLQAPR